MIKSTRVSLWLQNKLQNELLASVCERQGFNFGSPAAL
jgi:hypothetical protein